MTNSLVIPRNKVINTNKFTIGDSVAILGDIGEWNGPRELTVSKVSSLLIKHHFVFLFF